MKIEITPGCCIYISDVELTLLNKIKDLGSLQQSTISQEDMPHILKLINKHVLKRSNQSGVVAYEIRSGIDW